MITTSFVIGGGALLFSVSVFFGVPRSCHRRMVLVEEGPGTSMEGVSPDPNAPSVHSHVDANDSAPNAHMVGAKALYDASGGSLACDDEKPLSEGRSRSDSYMEAIGIPYPGV